MRKRGAMSQPLLNRLVFAGEAIVDLLMWVPALPERGGDVLAESAAIEVGGGFNIMAAAVRQGLPVVYAGGHGTGPWGDKVRAALAAEGIRLLRTPDPDADTGFDVALVEAGGPRAVVTAPRAEAPAPPGSWDPVPWPAGAAVSVRAGPGGGVVAGGVAGGGGGRGLSLGPRAAPAVDAVDTTGAGDAHSGVFLAGLAAGLTVGEAVRRANAAAALTITRAGAATSPSRAELDRFLAF